MRGVPRPSRLLAAPFVESWFYKLRNRVSRKLQRSREERQRQMQLSGRFARGELSYRAFAHPLPSRVELWATYTVARAVFSLTFS